MQCKECQVVIFAVEPQLKTTAHVNLSTICLWILKPLRSNSPPFYYQVTVFSYQEFFLRAVWSTFSSLSYCSITNPFCSHKLLVEGKLFDLFEFLLPTALLDFILDFLKLCNKCRVLRSYFETNLFFSFRKIDQTITHTQLSSACKFFS